MASRPTRREWASLVALIGAALALRLALAWVTPPFEAPDEEAHFRYVEFVALHGELPVQPPRDIERDLDFWPQYYQPPLAYLLMAPLEAGLRAAAVGEAGRVRALRCHNAALGALAVAFAFWIACGLTPRGDPRRTLIALVVALLPGFAANGASVNNDSLANLLSIALWGPLLAEDRRRGAWSAGLVFGAACAAKLTVLSQAPLLLLVPWLRRRDDPRAALRFACVAGGIAGLMLAPWLVRNAMVYGDPLAIGVGSMSFEWLAGVLPAEKLAEFTRPRPGHTFGIFFGQLGVFHNLVWTPIPVLWSALVALALFGWLRRGAEPDPLAARGSAFVLAPLLASAGLVWFSLRYYGGWQGRYLFPAMLPISALLAVGWQRFSPGPRAWLLVAAIAALLLALDAGLVLELERFFSETPPLRWGFKTSL